MSSLRSRRSDAALPQPTLSPPTPRPSQAGVSDDAPHLAAVIEHVPITAPKAYERNARAHNNRQITKLAGLIRSVGFLVPIIVDEDSVIIAGHGRWAAAKQIGLRRVPIIRAAHLTPSQVQAFRLADNRLGELSAWDDKTLALELKELAAIEGSIPTSSN